jgi:hypothetical protein
MTVTAFILATTAIGLRGLTYCVPDMVAFLRARREDIPAVMQARAKREAVISPLTRAYNRKGEH